MAEALQSDVTPTGVNQGDLVRVLANLRDVVNELITDHASYKTTVDGLVTLTTELRADHATFITAITNIGTTVANYKTIYDAHVHTADGNAARTSVPDAGTPVGSPSAPSVFTTTAATPPATITAAAAAAGPAALTNSTAITLKKG